MSSKTILLKYISKNLSFNNISCKETKLEKKSRIKKKMALVMQVLLTLQLSQSQVKGSSGKKGETAN